MFICFLSFLLLIRSEVLISEAQTPGRNGMEYLGKVYEANYVSIKIQTLIQYICTYVYLYIGKDRSIRSLNTMCTNDTTSTSCSDCSKESCNGRHCNWNENDFPACVARCKAINIQLRLQILYSTLSRYRFGLI